MLDDFRPLLDAVQGLDVSDPEDAERVLNERLDPAGPIAAALRERLEKRFEDGEIANRGEAPVRWSRVAKAGEETHGYSIDVVHMEGAGPRHRHPKGEIDFCMTLGGEARFDGRDSGWVVYGPDSVHTPTVTAGTMLIVYFLPEGAMEFLEN